MTNPNVEDPSQIEQTVAYSIQQMALNPPLNVSVESVGADLAAQLQALYNQGVRIFTCATTGDCETALGWSAAKAPECVFISGGSSANALALQDNLLRLVMPDASQTYALATFIRRQEFTSIAIVYRNDTYGQGFASALREDLILRGIEEVYLLAYSPTGLVDTASATSLVADPLFTLFSQVAFDAVTVVAFDEIQFILESIAPFPAQTATTWFGTDGIALSSAVFNSPTATQVAQQVALYSFLYTGDRFSPNYNRDAYVAAMLAATGQMPTPNTINIHDALQIMHDTCALANDRSLTFDKLAPYLLHTSNFGFGFSGVLAVDANGDRLGGTYAFYRVRDPAEFGNSIAWQQVNEVMMSSLSQISGLTKKSVRIGLDGQSMQTIQQEDIFQVGSGMNYTLARDVTDNANLALAMWLPISQLSERYTDINATVEDRIAPDVELNSQTIGIGLCPVSRTDAERTFVITLKRNRTTIEIQVQTQNLEPFLVGSLALLGVSVGGTEMDLSGSPPVFYLAYPTSVEISPQGTLPADSWGYLVEWAATAAYPFQNRQ